MLSVGAEIDASLTGVSPDPTRSESHAGRNESLRRLTSKVATSRRDSRLRAFRRRLDRLEGQDVP